MRGRPNPVEALATLVQLSDAAERRKQEDEVEDEVENEDEDDAEAEADEEESEAEEEEAPKKKKAAKPKATKRTRTPKVVRMKAVWTVFDNSNRKVAVYEYPRRQEAIDHAAKLTIDKKNTHFVQMVKEPMEEK